MTSVTTFIKGCRRSVQYLQNLSHVLQCHLMLLSDESCFVSNSQTCFWRKCRSQNGGKQWYNGLRPENPGVQTLAKLRMGHESPKKNTAFGWLISFGLYYSPLCFFEWCHPCQKEIARIPIHQPIFSWNLTFFWACQGRLKRCGWNCQGLRNFFHNQLPQLRLLGCLKSRFFFINFNAMGSHGAQPWDAFFVLQLMVEVEILLMKKRVSCSGVGFEPPVVGWNSSYFVVPT